MNEMNDLSFKRVDRIMKSVKHQERKEVARKRKQKVIDKEQRVFKKRKKEELRHYNLKAESGGIDVEQEEK